MCYSRQLTGRFCQSGRTSKSEIVNPLPIHAFYSWTNFDGVIFPVDLWRSEAYTKYFDFLDSKGGFYYEVRASPFKFGDASSHLSVYSAGEMHLSIA